MPDQRTPITIAGAGSIGCYVGGCLALAGRKVTLLGRPRITDRIASRGMRIIGLDGVERKVPRGMVEAASDPGRALARAGIVLITVKCGQTQEMADIVSACAPNDALVVSLQNGVDNPAILRSRLRRAQQVVAGMVPFNVVQELPGQDSPAFRRTTGGDVLIEAGIQGLSDTLDVDGLHVRSTTDMQSVLWGKLLLNLNNALNALSGLPLAEQLGDGRWRSILAAQVSEALATLAAARIAPARIGRIRPKLIPFILRLPDGLFRLVARQMLAVDPTARSSMWEDLNQRRKTEIDQFQGAILRLAKEKGREAPVSKAILALVRDAETKGEGSPRLLPEAVSAFKS